MSMILLHLVIVEKLILINHIIKNAPEITLNNFLSVISVKTFHEIKKVF